MPRQGFQADALGGMTTLDFRPEASHRRSIIEQIDVSRVAFVGLDDAEIIAFHLSMKAGGRKLPKRNPLALEDYPSSDSWAF